MLTLTANFNRLALYLAYRAGHLTWGQLPLTTQAACIQAGSLATMARYAATLTPAATTWCAATQARTGGVWLTNPALATVGNSTAPSTQAGTAAYRKVA